ncbi:BglG family transcription antiterminator [Enterococcus sp. BWB1-3]|uniref:BglG family transcription antiterminator n=1 Tax=unclassified Enterococcus TaxID=2608891 RepID=UPI0019214468|nr:MULTISPECIES: BglG family transcription antiterminator [unclassified Enterococcus]MBL1229179.1 BglG family transcription antiterminator [Enterococcus sp. BWB1-3]MCB5953399.1 BglG family transcription antiterminator [Enterococcus sp. CWB-B31]
MREEKIIQYLIASTGRQSLLKLADLFEVSPRTISSDIKLINAAASRHGFQITNKRGLGYGLEIFDHPAFNNYFTQLSAENEREILNPNSRKTNIALLLLFANDYLTMTQISNILAVSVSTVKKDMNQVRTEFELDGLTLYSKPHYGYKVVGSEENRRALIIQLLRNEITQPKITAEYAAFLSAFDEERFKAYLIQQIQQFEIKMNDLVLDNLVQHVVLLGFRIRQNNLLKEVQEQDEASTEYENLTDQIAAYLKAELGIQLPGNEKNYLTRQLYGKMLAVNELTKYDDLRRYIEQSLKVIDHKYHTFFSHDEELSGALILHVAPLLQRLYGGHQLENPIIEDVYTRYANVFTITYEFIQLISDNVEVKISKDEMGYLAIYFAASLEKTSQKEIKRYRSIAVICATGGGASYFLKTKLEQIFANAEVQTFSIIESNEIDEDFDLIISTVPIEQKFTKIPVIYTQALLTEKEIQKIQNDLLLIRENQLLETDVDHQLLSLFSKENFSIAKETSYLDLLKKRAERLQDDGYAAAEYTELVLQREKLLDTIYQNGIAGPHPMEARALKECIDVILLRPGLTYRKKPVRLIFLINIENGHLFLHKEISRLMIRMIDDQNLEKNLNGIKNYQDFSHYLRELIKKG